MAGSVSVTDMLDKWMVHIPPWREWDWDDARFRHTTQKRTQFETYEWFISGTFHVVFSDCSWQRVAETGKQNRR